MNKNPCVAPVVKWAGGKRRLLRALTALLPETVSAYCEPFLGGGAMLFELQPDRAFVNDINPELIRMYEVIRDDVEGLIASLERHRTDAEYFYAVRDWDRDPGFYASLSKVERASRMIFLNKTCYNGLYRVNSAGKFNTPHGRYRNPTIVNPTLLRAVSGYFNTAKIDFTCKDYAEVLEEVPAGSFVYLDPPYDPLSETSSFTGYAKGGFTREDQIRLRECCDGLDRRGIKFLLSNSATDFIRDQYKGYSLTTVRVGRALNAVAARRGPIDEVVVRNYA